LCYMPCYLILIMFGEEYRVWSFSLCSFLKSPVISLRPKYSPSVMFSNTLSLCTPLMSKTKFRTHREPQAKL
jgi:hypothetical protein